MWTKMLKVGDCLPCHCKWTSLPFWVSFWCVKFDVTIVPEKTGMEASDNVTMDTFFFMLLKSLPQTPCPSNAV